jgi:hypothetical protein
VPIVAAAVRSQLPPPSLEGWYAHIPGLKIVAPATLEDARGMLGAALRDANPVLIFEHVNLYNMEGELPAPAAPVALTGAAIRRPGRDLSIVTYGGSLHKCLPSVSAAAVEAAVIDQLRALLKAPEVVMATWRAAQAEGAEFLEDTVREALDRLDPLWEELFPAEQARIVQLLVQRIDLKPDGLELRLRTQGLGRVVDDLGDLRRAA